MFRRLLLGLLLLLLIAFVAVDRLAATTAAGKVGDRLRTEESLASTPKVTFGGFPFLPQALRGTYRDVHVVATDVRRGRLRLASVDAHLRGVHLSLSQALRGAVDGVRVDRVDGDALVRYADMTAALPNRDITLRGDKGQLRMQGSVELFGQRYSGSALGVVSVRPRELTIVPRDIRLGSGALNITVPPAVTGALTYTTPVMLPFGLQLRSVTPRSDGLLIRAAGSSVVLRRQ